MKRLVFTYYAVWVLYTELKFCEALGFEEYQEINEIRQGIKEVMDSINSIIKNTPFEPLRPPC